MSATGAFPGRAIAGSAGTHIPTAGNDGKPRLSERCGVMLGHAPAAARDVRLRETQFGNRCSTSRLHHRKYAPNAMPITILSSWMIHSPRDIVAKPRGQREARAAQEMPRRGGQPGQERRADPARTRLQILYQARACVATAAFPSSTGHRGGEDEWERPDPCGGTRPGVARRESHALTPPIERDKSPGHKPGAFARREGGSKPSRTGLTRTCSSIRA